MHTLVFGILPTAVTVPVYFCALFLYYRHSQSPVLRCLWIGFRFAQLWQVLCDTYLLHEVSSRLHHMLFPLCCCPAWQLRLARPLALKPYCLWHCCFCVGCWCRPIGTLWPGSAALVGYNQTNAQATNARLVTSLYALCIQKMTPTACALLEFTEAPLRILRVYGVVGIGIRTSTSPALDIAALCLSSWPAAIFTQTVPSDTAASQSAISFLTIVK